LAYKLLAPRWTTGVVGESALAEDGATGARFGADAPTAPGTERRWASDVAVEVGNGAGALFRSPCEGESRPSFQEIVGSLN